MLVGFHCGDDRRVVDGADALAPDIPDASHSAAPCRQNESLLEQTAAIDEKIKALQIELIGYRADSPDADRIGTEMLTLRDEKEPIRSQSALQAQRTNEIRELAAFFEGLSGPLITFDESYVRRLFTQITIYDDKVVFAFEDGKIRYNKLRKFG